ncbi:MAG: GNAT family N-acetyltransferase [Deltaproteobacteria bacterium]|nr:GNAT family N-acetyltransferase [Deltaproteobacteria bacterium]MBW2691634.1 GNAT family N-acetyltransferase [Deltaproteobacteria bacterium]
MLSVEWTEGVNDVARDEWNELVGAETPFLEWDWLASLEDAGAVGPETGWLPRPLLARDGGRLVAACPVYIKTHSEGEFVFDFAWAEAAARAGIPYYPKLLVGIPFTPVTGARFLIAPDVDRGETIRLLGSALRETCLSGKLSGVHINFCREHEAAALADDSDGARIDNDAYMLRVGFQYHWQNADYRTFDDYLGQFRSKRRNQIKRERREMERQGISIEVLTGDAITDDLIEPMFACYLATIENRYWGRQYLNPHFFELLRDRFRHRLCLVVARKGGEIIAGTTNVIKDDTLYGRYWGALQNARYLHFNVCYYAAIEHCIAAEIDRFEPGAGGDYKFLRGFDAQPTYSLHFLAEPRLAHAVAEFLHRERANAHAVIDHLRENSVLKSTSGPSDPASDTPDGARPENRTRPDRAS